MRKLMTVSFVLTLFVSIVLAGCSKNTPAATSTTAPSTASGSASAKPEATKDDSSSQPVKLSITWWGSQTRHDYTAKLLDMYTKLHPNVTFEATPSGWDGYFDKLSAEAAGGSMPDIIQMDYSVIATYTKNKTLADLTPFVNDKTIDMTHVDQNLLSSGRLNGQLTGIPLSSTALALTYNPDVFTKAGLALPTPNWKWSDFQQDMLTIAQKEKVFGIDKLEPVNYLPYWVRQHGKTLYTADGTKLGYDDDGILTDFIKMLSTLQQNKAMPTPDEWLQIASKGKEAEPVVTGKGGATFDWANYAVIVDKSNPNLKLVSPPYGADGTKALWIKPGMFFSVAQSSQHKIEAAKFINWFINDPDANKVINSERGIPVSSQIRDAMKATLTPQEQDMFAYTDVASKQATVVDPPDPAGAAEVIKALNNDIEMALYKKITPEEASAQFRKDANAILAKNAAK